MSSYAFITQILNILIFVFDSSFSYVLESDIEPSLTWPTEYHFKGEKTNLAYGIIEPFEIWYSAIQNKSRIDYFNGMVKTYYVGKTEDVYGAMYQVYPKWSEETENVIKCDRFSYSEEATNFLPSANFSYEGPTKFDGKHVEIWKSQEVDEDDYRIDEIIYVYRDGDVTVPLRYERQKHYIQNGALQNHYIVIYQEYNAPNAEDIEVENEKPCEDEGEWGKDFHTDLMALHPDIPSHVDEAFERYKKYHSKDYRHGDHELRKRIFRENWRHIQKHNSKNLSYKMGLNEFSDRSPEELAYLTATRFEGPIQGTEEFQYSELELGDMVKELPENFDLRIDGYISNVKHQAQCGSCWAFTTTAAVEGALTRSNGGRRLDLSEQSLVDCAWDYGNDGCDGGFLAGAFKYVLKYGIPTEEDYGLYMGQDGICHTENVTDLYKIRGFGSVPAGSVNAMKVALYKYGPVAVAIHAGDSMMKYSSGIFFDPECNDNIPNHGVVVVGYGVRDGALYWIIKNSWGEQWGEDGYMLISATDNNCHVLGTAVYPVP